MNAQAAPTSDLPADGNSTLFAGYEPIEVARLKFEAFNDGFGGDSLAQNFSNCNAQWLTMQFLELPTLSAKLYYASGEEYLNNATIFLRNASYPLNFCTDAAQQLYYFVEKQSEQYGSSSGFLRAAMLNIFANAIRV